MSREGGYEGKPAKFLPNPPHLPGIGPSKIDNLSKLLNQIVDSEIDPPYPPHPLVTHFRAWGGVGGYPLKIGYLAEMTEAEF